MRPATPNTSPRCKVNVAAQSFHITHVHDGLADLAGARGYNDLDIAADHQTRHSAGGRVGGRAVAHVPAVSQHDKAVSEMAATSSRKCCEII